MIRVLLAVAAGMLAGLRWHLDGGQVFVFILFTWLLLSSLYHGARAFRPRRRRGLRK